MPKNVRKPRDKPEEDYERPDPVSRHQSPVVVSVPSAAAMARRNEYALRPKGQSRYGRESSSPRNRDGWTFFGPTTKCVKLPKKAFKPGMIIRAVIHEPYLDQASRSSNTTTVRTIIKTFYGLITSEMRKMIVITLY